MRFTLTKDLHQAPLMRALMRGLALFVTLFVALDAWMMTSTLGSDSATITLTLYGDSEAYIDALPWSSVLEMVHMGLFFGMLILGTLGALVGRLAHHQNRALWALGVAMGGALASFSLLIGAAWGIESLILPYVVVMMVWHMTASLLGLWVLWTLR